MFDDIPDILTAKECQQLLKIGKNSMLRYLKTGEIEGFKIGSRWRIYKFSVIEFMIPTNHLHTKTLPSP